MWWLRVGHGFDPSIDWIGLDWVGGMPVTPFLMVKSDDS